MELVKVNTNIFNNVCQCRTSAGATWSNEHAVNMLAIHTDLAFVVWNTFYNDIGTGADTEGTK